MVLNDFLALDRTELITTALERLNVVENSAYTVADFNAVRVLKSTHSIKVQFANTILYIPENESFYSDIEITLPANEVHKFGIEGDGTVQNKGLYRPKASDAAPIGFVLQHLNIDPLNNRYRNFYDAKLCIFEKGATYEIREKTKTPEKGGGYRIMVMDKSTGETLSKLEGSYARTKSPTPLGQQEVFEEIIDNSTAVDRLIASGRSNIIALALQQINKAQKKPITVTDFHFVRVMANHIKIEVQFGFNLRFSTTENSYYKDIKVTLPDNFVSGARDYDNDFTTNSNLNQEDSEKLQFVLEALKFDTTYMSKGFQPGIITISEQDDYFTFSDETRFPELGGGFSSQDIEKETGKVGAMLQGHYERDPHLGFKREIDLKHNDMKMVPIPEHEKFREITD
ncbi:hypothetical protein [Maribacter sp. 2-571]|uniref:hypothetical protein n=1 Tax=Maribacter sp. 2-571 TaxID=3417569 RepID=UPI003D33B35B